ncbi:MAG: ribonuclease III [Treponema sp.]|nr:ribonuclease III [Treponema sp.]
MSASRKKLLLDFQKNNNLNFKDISLLDLAFTHRSVVNENSFLHENNERVEFLGDAVLEMVTAAYLYEKYKTESEGDLAKIKSAVVSEASLADIGLKLGVDKCLLLGKGEENTGGRKKKAILADCVEAIIGAYYLDSGYKATEKFILLWMIAVVEGFKQNPALKDYKTQLQELCQKQFKVCPKYQMIKKSGPDHNRTFWMSVDINGTVFGPAKGKNKKEAEQSVAKIALNNFEK